MKNQFTKILTFIVLLASVVYACNNSDNNEVTNTNPGTFSVTNGTIEETSAVVNWSESIDPDGDAVTYSINLNSTEIASGITLLTYTFTGLTASTNYNGIVVASDGNGGSRNAEYSFTTIQSVPVTIHPAFTEFSDNTNIYLSGNNVVIETSGLPNHTSPYWSNTTERNLTGPMGNIITTPAAATNHPLFVEPTATSYETMAPGNIDDFNGSYTLTVSTNPSLASSSSATGLGSIGIAISGATIYNDKEGPNIPLDNAIGSLDYTAAHTGPQSYHYHLETKAWSNDDEKLIGIIADGFFLYGRKCNSTGNYPTNLDASGGHTSTTQHASTAEYHYHIQNELYLNQYYILFPGDYQGTASQIQ